MSYITPSGSYYEGDRASVNDVACARRPEGYLFTGTVSLDPQIMWRAKTAAELSAERDAEAMELRQVKLALAASLEIIFAFVKDPASISTAGILKQAVIDRYKTKL